MAAGDADAQRFRVRTPGGAVRWVDARAVALRDDGGAVEGFIRTICDISTQVDMRETERYLQSKGVIPKFRAHS